MEPPVSDRSSEDPFSDYPVAGRLPIEQRLRLLRDLGEESAEPLAPGAAQQKSMFALGLGVSRKPRAWEHTGHTIGFCPAARAAIGTQQVFDAGRIVPDRKLRNSTVTLTLDRLRLADYPGGETHRVLFDFCAQHALYDGALEHLHFAATLRAAEGQDAAQVRLPIFVNLAVGEQGLAFAFRTVNVDDEGSRRALDLLDSDPIKAGLRLSRAPHPATAALSQLALALARSVLGSPRNVGVQELYLGLDFDSDAPGARLAEGSYLAVQLGDPAAWSWGEWVWDCAAGRIVAKSDPHKLCPYNYLVFRVSRRPDS
jgi:hypothetical protein